MGAPTSRLYTPGNLTRDCTVVRRTPCRRLCVLLDSLLSTTTCLPFFKTLTRKDSSNETPLHPSPFSSSNLSPSCQSLLVSKSSQGILSPLLVPFNPLLTRDSDEQLSDVVSRDVSSKNQSPSTFPGDLRKLHQ